MKIALCQLNPVVGDISGNLDKIFKSIKEAYGKGGELIVFPELSIQGYPPRDLLEQHWFIEKSVQAVERIKNFLQAFKDCAVIIGVSWPEKDYVGRGLFNSAIFIRNGKIEARADKILLPTYDVFDEARYFDSGENPVVIEFKGKKLGLTICEDAWNNPAMWQHTIYKRNPVKELKDNGAEIIINISASPFHKGKEKLRYELIKKHAVDNNVSFVFVNTVGANDELIFDGGSMYVDKKGNVCTQLCSFKEEIKIIDTETENINTLSNFQELGSIARVHDALILGIKDYLKKTGFEKVVIGLSGGIDSAVTAVLAVKALGNDNVLGITMPSHFSSSGSVEDSIKLAQNLGIKIHTIPIKDIFDSLQESVKPFFKDLPFDSTEENMQARIRGLILMSFSNKFNRLVLTTGNKSELAVGYSTLYGDMCGGLAVISDLYKTEVYKLAEYINRKKEIIPDAIITKAPSAELRPGQKDQDTLPPYDILDSILRLALEEGLSSDDIISRGYKKDTVKWVIRAIQINEYKRRQAPPGLKISQKAFGMGRRFPIAAKYDW